ncbi:MAG: hypothetical protein ACD_23C01018G0003 [uncultured bacterium]|nr:MAG: hypothetical protein ACD_23C01018G0003 [uncultured bacterium]
MKKIVFVLAVASAVSLSVGAADRQFDAFMGRVVGNQTTVSFGGNGQPMVTSSAHLGNAPAVGNMRVTGDASGVRLEGRANAPVPGTSKTVPVDIKAPISKANFGKALLVAGKLAWPIGVALQAGDIYDYLSSSGLSDINNTANGVTATVPDSSAILSDGYMWSGSASCVKPTALMAAQCRLAEMGGTNLSSCTIEYNGSSALATCRNNNNTGDIGIGLSRSNSSCASGYYWVGNVCTNNPPRTTLNEQAIIDRIAQQSGWPTSSTRALAEALNVPGVAPMVTTETPNIVGPFAVPGEKTTTAEPVKLIPGTTTIAPPGTAQTESGTKTTVKDSTTKLQYNQDKINASTSVTTNTTITNNVTNQTFNEGDTITETQEKPEVEVCGLPGTSACKIDETGTPEAKPETAEADAKKAIKPLEDFVANPTSALPTLPTINWAFTLPSGCAPIALPAFEPWLQQIDVCAFQPMFHDLMSFVWVMGGIFGAIGTFWRNTFSQG